MVGLVGLGRFRGVGLGESPAMYSYFIVYFLVTNMDPIMWSSSDPALKLGMRYYGPAGEAGHHIFGTASDPNTVDVLLRQDQRVGWAELIRQDPIEEPAPEAPPVAAEPETRPEPGKPAIKLPGYVPKMPGESGGKLTWADKAAAESVPVPVDQKKCDLSWCWLLLLLALVK
jgi:hypothetical protein